VKKVGVKKISVKVSKPMQKPWILEIHHTLKEVATHLCDDRGSEVECPRGGVQGISWWAS
jgi:hypothetical protein